MRIPSWKELVELFGFLGVIASLIFVALEIRQNTDALRSASIHDILRWSGEGPLMMIENPGMRDAWLASCNYEQLTADQRLLLINMYSSGLRVQLNRFHQTRLGILDEDLALSLAGRTAMYRHPIFAEIWAGQRAYYDPGFQTFVERELLSMVEDRCPVFGSEP